MRCVEFPADLARLDDWLEEERQTYSEQIRDEANAQNKTTPRDHPKRWKEWWTLRQAATSLGVNAVFGTKFVAEHVDDGKGGPDFLLTFAESKLALDVTEATSSADRVAIKKGRLAAEHHLVGELGGRGLEGWNSDEPERCVAADIAEAIGRKKYHRYGSRAALLVYVNSNPSSVVRDSTKLARYLAPIETDNQFDFVLIVLGAKRPLIRLTALEVQIFV